MRIVSHRRLKDFYETKGYEDSRVTLERWYHKGRVEKSFGYKG